MAPALRLVRAPAAVMAALVFAAAALAAWSGDGTGQAAAGAFSMPGGGAPVAAVVSGGVALRWPAAGFVDGKPVAGYVIRRYDAAGNAQVVGAGCSGVVPATSCAEGAVPSGIWTFTDTPVQESWTGAGSKPSNAVTVPGP